MGQGRSRKRHLFEFEVFVFARAEASTDLVNWGTIETPIIGSGGVVTRFYSTEGQPKRFFRSRRN
jgi:hypothetical protein